MPHDHPGFEYWQLNDLNHPFPVGEIDLVYGTPNAVAAYCTLAPPKTQPTPAMVAERSIGVARSGQLWFALECATDALGNVTCEGVLRGRHLHFYKEHGETEPGPLLEIRLSAAELKGAGSREVLGDHGKHCDSLMVEWYQDKDGKPRCYLSVIHLGLSIRKLIEMREKAKQGVDEYPEIIIEPLDEDSSAPVPPPPPRPEPPVES